MKTKEKAQEFTLLNEYFHYKSLFVQNFQNLLHNEIHLDRIFKIGLVSRPVLHTLPSTLFQAEYVMNQSAHRQADVFFPELYHHYLKKKNKLLVDEVDEGILVSLIHYAIWRYRLDWIFSLADLVREGHIVSKVGNEILQCACLLSFLQGEQRRASIIEKYITSGSPFYYLLISFYMGKKIDHDGGSYDQNVSAKKVLWYDLALHEDDDEKALVNRIIYERPRDIEKFIDTYSTLLHRGFVFLAIRYLLRFQNEFSKNKFVQSLILSQYLLARKHILYLRRLGKLDYFPNHWSYFEARFCIAMLGEDESSELIMKQLTQGKSTEGLSLEADQKYRFEQSVLAAQKNIMPEDLGDAWLDSLLKVVWLQKATGSLRVQKSFSFFENMLSNTMEKGCAIEVLSLYFCALNDKFMLYANKKIVQNVWLLYQSLSARFPIIRLHLGLLAYERGYMQLSKKYLQNQAVLMDDQLHRLAEIEICDDNIAKALTIYERLVKYTPDSHILYFNLGILYEKVNQVDNAIKAFSRTLEISPGYIQARDRIDILK